MSIPGLGGGGEGGLSVFTMTIQQNTEYTVKLGQVTGSGGSGGQFFYKKDFRKNLHK